MIDLWPSHADPTTSATTIGSKVDDIDSSEVLEEGEFVVFSLLAFFRDLESDGDEDEGIGR